MWRSSSLSSSPTSDVNPCLPKTIEQVWNDVSIPPHPHLHRASTPARVILQDFFSKEPPPPAAVSPPPTLLNLNNPSSSRDHFQTLLLNTYHHPILPFDALVSDDVTATAGKRRNLDSGRYSGDGRNKRMMKNRVSAARSRARKQAYTNELELQVAQLRRQNAALRKQQQQLHIAAAGAEAQEKKLLHRTSSAPF